MRGGRILQAWRAVDVKFGAVRAQSINCNRACECATELATGPREQATQPSPRGAWMSALEWKDGNGAEAAPFPVHCCLGKTSPGRNESQQSKPDQSQ